MTYQCKICGETHNGLPDIGYKWPDPYFGVPESDRDSRVRATSDTCVIDEEDYFIRGIILIPVHGEEQQFGLGVWVSQKQENFNAYLANFDSPEIGFFFGWLSTSLPFYSVDTWAMKTMDHFQGKGQRPLIEPEAADHPLYADYSQGISLEKAWEYVHWNIQ